MLSVKKASVLAEGSLNNRATSVKLNLWICAVISDYLQHLAAAGAVAPMPTFPELSMRRRSVGLLAPSAVVLKTSRPGISPLPAVPSTLPSMRAVGRNSSPSEPKKLIRPHKPPLEEAVVKVLTLPLGLLPRSNLGALLLAVNA